MGILRQFDLAQYDYGRALFADAKVYQLAHYKAIDALRALALQHLQKTLLSLDPVGAITGSHNLAALFELMRDVYANTDHLENRVEPLRAIVSTFITRNFSALQTHPTMLDLLGEGGDLVLDVLRKLSTGPIFPSPGLPVPLHSAPRRYIARLRVSGLPPSCP